MTNICFSGGAVGSDTEWGKAALKKGHTVKHFSFHGHTIKNIPPETLVVLPVNELLLADPFLKVANKTLKRKFPTSNGYVNNLLRRNYYQIKDSHSVYAIGNIVGNLVEGGTAWATQMFIDGYQSSGLPRAWVFNQIKKQWHTYDGMWVPCDLPPEPEGSYAAIGTRSPNQDGLNAITKVMRL